MVKIEDLSFKFLMDSGYAPYTGKGWALPKNGKPGRWKKLDTTKSPLRICARGYHLVRWDTLHRWAAMYGFDRLFIAEYRGEKLEDLAGDKFCVSEARLVKELAPKYVGEGLNWPFNTFDFRMACYSENCRKIIVKWLQDQGVDVE